MLEADGSISLHFADLGYVDERYTLMLDIADARGRSRARVAVAVSDGGRKELSPREMLADLVFRRSSLDGDGSRPLGMLLGIESGVESIGPYLLATVMSAVRRRSFAGAWRTVRALSPKARFPRVEEYEANSLGRGSGGIFFEPRAWDPRDGSDPGDREVINEYRAELIRALRSEYGPRYTGGFVANPFAIEHYGDLLCTASSERSDYLRRMRTCDIGIASIGLHRSTPFKIPEYLAAGRAVLTEPLHFEMGPEPGLAIAEFASVHDCVEQIDSLLSRPVELAMRQDAARAYWRDHVRPDQVMARMLRSVREAV
ncbi:glycosyltransferase family 1 protein [Propioniciclava sp. MC1683]|uniref:glycosyltransferase n=1 Tax=Propioniciclava sp. MC1683 TaxID=2760309 RepID=UPI0015FF5E5C|nr:glycosyltransferase [Propioniciclava sp. MC1683]MBB1501286.1 glycosyltransferase family 1 protein [Propioniciclava sp. MC1683]